MSFRQELLDSIQSDMKLNKAFFLKIYADSIYCPEFKDKAIKALNDIGCSRAEEYYNMVVTEYQKKHDGELKPVAKELRRKWEADWKRLQKGSEEKRKQEEAELLKRKKRLLMQKSQTLTGS